MANKITKKDMFNKVLAAQGVAENAELRDFIQKQIELLEAKSASRKSAADKDENIALREELASILTDMGRAVTVTEIMTENADFAAKAVTNQKISALLKQLIAEGRVNKTMDKKKAYFSAV